VVSANLVYSHLSFRWHSHVRWISIGDSRFSQATAIVGIDRLLAVLLAHSFGVVGWCCEVDYNSIKALMKPRHRWFKPFLITAVLCLCAWGSFWFLKWHILSGPWLNSLAFSPDGKTLAGAGGWKIRQSTTSHLGIVWLWDAQTGARRARLVVGKKLLGHAAFSPDGRQVSAWRSDGAQFLWDVQEGGLPRIVSEDASEIFLRLQDHRALIQGDRFPCLPHSSGCLSTDDTTPFTRIHRMALQNVSDNEQLIAISDNRLSMAVEQFSQNTRSISVKEIATGTVRARLSPAPNNVKVARYSPDGQTLLLYGYSSEPAKEALLWHIGSQRMTTLKESDVLFPVAGAFSPDGKRVAVGGLYGDVQLWDVASGKSLAKWKGS
jgi:WD40 repeat protein